MIVPVTISLGNARFPEPMGLLSQTKVIVSTSVRDKFGTISSPYSFLYDGKGYSLILMVSRSTDYPII